MSKDTLKLLKDHLKWLETPEGKQSIIDYFKDKEQKKQNLIDYVGSEEFNKTYQIIYDWVKENGRIDDTDIHYKFNPGIELETEEWNKFTDSISEKYEGSEIVDTEASFPKYHFEYGALNVYFMHGQGTDCWITYNKQTDRDSKLNEIL
jgi:regulator of sigma D